MMSDKNSAKGASWRTSRASPMGNKAASKPDKAKMMSRTVRNHSLSPGLANDAAVAGAAPTWVSSTNPVTIKISSGPIFATARTELTFAPALTPTTLIAAKPPMRNRRTRARPNRPCALGRNPPRYSMKRLALAAPEVSLTSHASHAIWIPASGP